METKELILWALKAEKLQEESWFAFPEEDKKKVSGFSIGGEYSMSKDEAIVKAAPEKFNSTEYQIVSLLLFAAGMMFKPGLKNMKLM